VVVGSGGAAYDGGVLSRFAVSVGLPRLGERLARPKFALPLRSLFNNHAGGFVFPLR
jgi:hypothetical protein